MTTTFRRRLEDHALELWYSGLPYFDILEAVIELATTCEDDDGPSIFAEDLETEDRRHRLALSLDFLDP